MRRFFGILAVTALLAVACAPAAAPAPAAAKPQAPKAPAQPQAPAPAVAPQPAPAAPAEAKPQAAPLPKPTGLTPKYGGHLVIPVKADWSHFDPHLDIAAATQWRASLVYLRLVKTEAGKDVYDIQVTPDLAERWEASADGKVWTFYLRKGVKWANVAPLNGREVTADDVAYSFERALSPVHIARGNYDSIKKFEKVDKYTVRFTLRDVNSQFLSPIIADAPSWIIPKEVIDQYGDLKSWGIGAGPFMLEKSQKGTGSFYKKNPDYFDAQRIYVDNYDVPLIPDIATALAAFRAGKVDVLGGGSGAITLTKVQLDALLKTNPDSQHISYSAGSVTGLWIRFGAEPFNDVRIRKALNHALDRDAMIKVLWQGDSQYQGYVGGAYPDYSLSQEELRSLFKYDPALSKKLLAEAGFPKGFKTNIMWRSSSASAGTIAGQVGVELYKQFFKDVGIELDLSVYGVDDPRYVADAYQGNYPYLAAGSGGIAGALGTLYAFNHTKGARNGTKSSVATVDELIEKAYKSLDIKEQQRLSKEVQRLLATEVLYILPCCDSRTYESWQPWVVGYRPSSSGTYSRETSFYIWLNK